MTDLGPAFTVESHGAVYSIERVPWSWWQRPRWVWRLAWWVRDR